MDQGSPSTNSPTPTSAPGTPWLKTAKAKWLLTALGMAFLGFSYWYSLAYPDTSNPSPQQVAEEVVETTNPNSQTANPPKVTAATPSKTVETSGGFALTKQSAFNCTAEAPADWTMSSNNESNSADLFGPGKTLYAGYGIQAVNTALAPYASAYQAPLNDPDLYSSDPAVVTKGYAKAIMAAIGGSGNVSYTSDYNQAIGDYTLRSVATSTHKGVIFFHTAGIPGDGVNYSYAEPMYLALTTNDLWDTQGLLVAQIASTIRCNAQLVQHDGPVVKAQTSSGSSSSGSADTNGSADGYNPQLGTEYVHDSSTGENYLVDPSQNWSSDGPSGAGYYKANGNDYTKLEAGRSD